jgi:RNA recognition motif-containing protein
MGMAMGEGRSLGGAPNPNNRNLFIGNVSLGNVAGVTADALQLPLQASWQDLKDLMRQAGEVIRADIGFFPDGRPKGNGTAVFVNPEDARAAIGACITALREDLR